MTHLRTPVRPLAAFALGTVLPGAPVFAFDAASMVRLGVVRTRDRQNSVPGLTMHTGAAYAYRSACYTIGLEVKHP